MFSRIFWIRIYEFFHQYFSVEKENKFVIGHIRHFILSFEHLRKSKQKIRRLVFGKFVKICCELDLSRGFLFFLTGLTPSFGFESLSEEALFITVCGFLRPGCMSIRLWKPFGGPITSGGFGRPYFSVIFAYWSSIEKMWGIVYVWV